MSSIDHFDLRAFDLNLLIAFDALMQERTVTRAAERLKIRQPAMSHNLATLRVLMQDDLFVRVGQVMRPTARAIAVAPRIRTALQQMQEVLYADEVFDPRTQTRTFRLGFSSEVEVLLMPRLTKHLQRVASGLKLLARPINHAQAHALLDDGGLDVLVGCFDYSAGRHRGQPLFEQTLACCFNPRLLPFEPPLSTEAYLATPHVLLTVNDTLQGCMEAALARAGAKLNVVMAGSEFLTVMSTAAESPVLATLPARMASVHGPRFGLTSSPVPLELQIPPVAMVWSAQADRDPGVAWLREQIVPILASYDGPMAAPGSAERVEPARSLDASLSSRH